VSDDTTLLDRIEIELAAARKGDIESRRRDPISGTCDCDWMSVHTPNKHRFDWQHYDYRIKPKPTRIYVNEHASDGLADMGKGIFWTRRAGADLAAKGDRTAIHVFEEVKRIVL